MGVYWVEMGVEVVEGFEEVEIGLEGVCVVLEGGDVVVWGYELLVERLKWVGGWGVVWEVDMSGRRGEGDDVKVVGVGDLG